MQGNVDLKGNRIELFFSSCHQNCNDFVFALFLGQVK